MVRLVIVLIAFCGLCLAQGPIEVKCEALVTKNAEPIAVLKFDLARCEDVQFKGGGVVIRYISDKLMGAWSIRYLPAHQVKAVAVTPKKF